MCLQDAKLAGHEDDFRQLYYMLGSILHFEFQQIIESLKDSYAPVDSDTDTCTYNNAQPLSDINFVELLGGLLEKANYEQISEDDFNQTLTEASMFKIRLHVDFDDFSEEE